MIGERCITTTTATTIGLDDNNQFYLWHIEAYQISWIPYVKKRYNIGNFNIYCNIFNFTFIAPDYHILSEMRLNRIINKLEPVLDF